jgi:hypothetical protein
MRGDFSRLTHDPSQRFSAVLLQQGRVLLDADWNEQRAIDLHSLRALTADLIGPHGGPRDGAGFEIGEAVREDARLDFRIGAGRYYVDGLAVENRAEDLRLSGLSYPDPPNPPERGEAVLAYLEVWEREATFLDHVAMREVALGGPDTCLRARVEWRVRLAPVNERGEPEQPIPRRDAARRPLLTAGTTEPPASQEPCVLSPEARYRGAENQLYRVEIHRGGEAAGTGGATFKWSRENGSVLFAVRSVDGPRLSLDHLGRDERLSLAVGDWVEVSDAAQAAEERAEELLRVEKVDRPGAVVTLSATPGWIGDDAEQVQVRRWDHRAGKRSAGGLELDGGAAKVEEGRRLVLEDGLEIEFVDSEAAAAPRDYRTGDYWLIPARTATGGIEWPPPGRPDPCPPLGVTRRYAPLATITRAADDSLAVEDQRRFFGALAAP